MAAPQHLKLRVSENNGLPWTQHPDYVEVCRTISRSGDPTSYSPPHHHGSSLTDRTQFSVGLAGFNVNNLPEVFYHLWPSKEWWDHAKSAKPPQKIDANGNLMFERTPRDWAPRPLLDFPILKNLDTISSEVPAWFIELLMRMDGRLDWKDILMRIKYPGGRREDEKIFRNTLQQRMGRARERFSMVSWRDTAGISNAVRDRVLSGLTPAQLAARGGLGTTRGITPGSRDSQGRVIPVPGRRARGTANAGTTASQIQQPQVQTAHAGPLNAPLRQNYPNTDAGSATVILAQNQPSRSQDGSRSDQPNVQSNSATHPSASSVFFPNRRRSADTKPTMVDPQEYHSSTSYAAHTSPQPYSSRASNAGPSYKATLPIMGGRKASNAAEGVTQHKQPSAAQVADEYTQHVPNNTPYAEATANQYSQHREKHAGSLSGNYIQTVTSHVGASTGQQNIRLVPYSSSSEGSDGVDEKDRDEDEEDKENDEGYGDAEDDVEMPLAEEDPRMKKLTANERRELERYLEQDRIRTQMCLDGRMSLIELMSVMQSNEAELKSGLKRARGDISDDDEVEEMHNRRAKRTKRGVAAVSGNQPLSETHRPTYSGFDEPQPGPSGEYHRQGALANTYRRPTTRPIGSAVQRLHNDRLRRPAPKATHKKTTPYYPQPDMVTGDEEYNIYNFQIDSQQPQQPSQQRNGLGDGIFHSDVEQPRPGLQPYQSQQEIDMGNANTYTNTGELQPRPSSRRQRQAGSERFSSVLNSTVEEISGDAPAHVPDNALEGYNSHDCGDQSNPVESARIDAYTAPRRAYQQPTASTVRDDPFFSDELFNGMLDGRPDANHVGSMYTRAQQREIDNYYQRLMAPRAGVENESGTPEDVMPPPPRFREEELQTVFVADLLDPHSRPQAAQAHIPYNVPVDPVQGGNAPPVAQTPPDDSLVVGNITSWDPAWSAFGNDHDAGPLLRGHYPDEYP
ncbi:hypothetical protein HO173_012983 [Letharia columbiana]|uniref:Uncharacterized protein n=1 Tax=Letharia columbiana TaxID=112416 RepID=A0A8H6CJA3_9LECA|nr:uncharacterized protein HO173_012983 [Letharia columbiana]KAF6224640.1 hypothetical protein HO173_012983 [Letharia columbiana]